MRKNGITLYSQIRNAIGQIGPVKSFRIADYCGISKSSVSKYRPMVEHFEPGFVARSPFAMGAAPELSAVAKWHLKQIDPNDFASYGKILWSNFDEDPKVRDRADQSSTEEAKTEEAKAEAIDITTTTLDTQVPAEKSTERTMDNKPVEKTQQQVALEALQTLFAGGQQVDMAQVAEMVREEVERQGKGKIEISIRGEIKVMESKNRHYAFPKALRILSATGLLALVGPAGSGKTTMAAQIAEALELDFAAYSCTQGMSEGQLTGRLGFDNIYLESAFVRCYEHGGVVILDEFDALSDNVRLVINSAIANGFMSVPNRVESPMAKRHEDFYLVIGMNTFGLGSTESYSGRDMIDLATRDRFSMSTIYVDYDRDIEAGIEGLGDWAPQVNGSDRWTASRKFDMSPGRVLETIRTNIQKHDIPSRCLSTRNKVDLAKLLKAGFTTEDCLESYFSSWEKSDVELALQGVA